MSLTSFQVWGFIVAAFMRSRAWKGGGKQAKPKVALRHLLKLWIPHQDAQHMPALELLTPTCGHVDRLALGFSVIFSKGCCPPLIMVGSTQPVRAKDQGLLVGR